MKENISPKDYFEDIKKKKNNIDDEGLCRVYDNCLTLLNKAKMTGQKKAMKKLIFHLESIEKEREIVKLGFDTFIYRDDIEQYIESVAKNVVKIIELENYEREIPDEIVEVIDSVKDKFDALYVIFTDYTGKIEREVEQERKEKDPIIFGTFQDENSKSVIDRFYYIGDWEDEYCDLTLDKMVNEMKSENINIVRKIKTPEDIQELKSQLGGLSFVDGSITQIAMSDSADWVPKRSFFNKIKTFFTRGK